MAKDITIFLKNENIKILNLTNFQREFMINQGFNKQRLFVFPNLIKLENFKKLNIRTMFSMQVGYQMKKELMN